MDDGVFEVKRMGGGIGGVGVVCGVVGGGVIHGKAWGSCPGVGWCELVSVKVVGVVLGGGRFVQGDGDGEGSGKLAFFILLLGVGIQEVRRFSLDSLCGRVFWV